MQQKKLTESEGTTPAIFFEGGGVEITLLTFFWLQICDIVNYDNGTHLCLKTFWLQML